MLLYRRESNNKQSAVGAVFAILWIPGIATRFFFVFWFCANLQSHSTPYFTDDNATAMFLLFVSISKRMATTNNIESIRSMNKR